MPPVAAGVSVVAVAAGSPVADGGSVVGAGAAGAGAAGVGAAGAGAAGAAGVSVATGAYRPVHWQEHMASSKADGRERGCVLSLPLVAPEGLCCN